MSNKLDKEVKRILDLATVGYEGLQLLRKRRLVRHKLAESIKPSFNMRVMLKMLQQKPEGLSFYESLALDWRSAGGLMVRGLVMWDFTAAGEQRMIAVQKRVKRKYTRRAA